MNFIDLTAIVHPTAKVWHFAVVLADVIIGPRVSIGSSAEIGRGTTIGEDSRIGSHVFLPSKTTVGKNVFIGPGVVATDDRFPRVNNPDYIAMPPIFEDGCSVGAGAVILPGVRIGAGAIVGAGAVVTKDVPARTVIRGDPARVRRDYTQGACA